MTIQRYQERDTTKSTMDYGKAQMQIEARRAAERTLMAQRADEIEAGLVHESWAMALDRKKKL